MHEYLQEFPEQQDVLRYTLTANAPETKDNDFTWKDFQAKNNNELVAILGNFINRIAVLTNKYYEGFVPQPNTFTANDEAVLSELQKYPEKIHKSIHAYRFREACQEFMNIARLGNKYLSDEEPWLVIKEDATRVETIMYVALQIGAALATLAEPFLPFTSQKIKTILQLKDGITPRFIAENKEYIAPKHKIIEKAPILFSKIDDATITKQLEKLEATKKENEAQIPQKETIAFDDFLKLDLRIGTIETAEKIKKTKKLLKLTVNVGLDTRTIVSGIAESFSPEEIIGQQVVVLLNLAPRKLKGVESQGMVLMTNKPDGTLTFVSPDATKDPVKNGSEVS